jgi:hypothetical protein
MGRTVELVSVHARLTTAPQSTPIELPGEIGMGKSTLTVRAAHFPLGNFPDGPFRLPAREQ